MDDLVPTLCLTKPLKKILSTFTVHLPPLIGAVLLLSPLSHAETTNTSEHILPNGLKVIIREDHRAPMVMSHIWYKVGSADEPQNLMGISHVLEHMMFKGTNKVPNDEFTRLSRKYGGTINAATFTNYTNYYQLYPKAYFPLALELEADRMVNLQLRQEDFEPEIKVVMEERRQRTDDNPRAKAYEQFKSVSYQNSHYKQPIIGTMQTLNQIRLKDLKQWYQKWYSPNNAILVIVGDVETNQALSLVKQYFGQIPAQSTPKRNSVTESEKIGFREMQIKTNVEVPNLYMTWNTKSIATAKHPNDAYTLNMIRSILDSGISSRLQERLVRKQKLLTTVSVSYDPYNRGDSLFSISAIPAPNTSLEIAEQAIIEQLNLLKIEPVANYELERIKTRFLSNLVYNQDNIAEQAKMLGNLAVNDLNFDIMDNMPKYFDALQPQDIQRVAREFFISENLSRLHLLPETSAQKTQ